MKTVTLPGGEAVPALGLGTWKMGVGDRDEAEQRRAIETGIAHGTTLIDTAEMYGEGRSEELVGQAIAGKRDKVFLVSKVLPSNASRRGTVAACERSLKRLGTGMIDLYLLHWRSSYPLADTVAAFMELQAAGKIRHWGVSNFDTRDLGELAGVSDGAGCAANQVLYNAASRGMEFDLYPKCHAAGMAMMAYCPLGEGPLLRDPVLQKIANRHGVSASAVAIAFTLRLPGVISIPKTSHAARMIENAAAGTLQLTAQDLREIDAAFPPPRRKMPLDIV
ncbi:aldo/keto reductase [Aestuariivirga sp.]|uniref:aldo/keto reductase n=1 Tax=Aestuariivirga sp. TaxID=2650926 RepID=UPI0039E2D9EE